MKINFTPIKYNSTSFGNRMNCNLHDNSVVNQINDINHEYDIKSSYLSYLTEEIGLPKYIHDRQQDQLKLNRNEQINFIIQEDLDDEDNILERLTY